MHPLPILEERALLLNQRERGVERGTETEMGKNRGWKSGDRGKKGRLWHEAFMTMTKTDMHSFPNILHRTQLYGPS